MALHSFADVSPLRSYKPRGISSNSFLPFFSFSLSSLSSFFPTFCKLAILHRASLYRALSRETLVCFKTERQRQRLYIKKKKKREGTKAKRNETRLGTVRQRALSIRGSLFLRNGRSFAFTEKKNRRNPRFFSRQSFFGFVISTRQSLKSIFRLSLKKEEIYIYIYICIYTHIYIYI